MGFHNILGEPVARMSDRKYKGLYRSEPPPPFVLEGEGYFDQVAKYYNGEPQLWLDSNSSRKEMLELWEKYSKSADTPMGGVTTEMTFEELTRYMHLLNDEQKRYFEVVYFDFAYVCPHEATYYGIEVMGINGHSLIGDGFFHYTPEPKNDDYYLYEIVKKYFREKFNEHVLFSSEEDARLLLNFLEERKMEFPNYYHEEIWKIVHVFGVIDSVAS